MHEDFARNLRLLCSYYRSVAEVCRRLDINRPQFNRYLSGRYRPSAHTLRRFCAFFGVEEHEILLPSAQFERLVQVRPRRPALAQPSSDLASSDCTSWASGCGTSARRLRSGGGWTARCACSQLSGSVASNGWRPERTWKFTRSISAGRPLPGTA